MITNELKQLSVAVRSKQPLVSISNYDEERFLYNMISLAKSLNRDLYVWKRTKGLGDFRDPERVSWDSNFVILDDLLVHLEQENLTPETKASITVFLDVNELLDDSHIQRLFKDLYFKWSIGIRTGILHSPLNSIPDTLQKFFHHTDFSLPTLEDIEIMLDKIQLRFSGKNYTENFCEGYAENKKAMADSLLGLNEFEMMRAVLYGVVKNSQFNGAIIPDLLEHKKQIVKKSGLLEFLDTEKVSSVGGLENLMEWLHRRGKAFSKKAREFGLPYPKGLFMLGVPGTGKSLVAKSVAKMWQMPCISWDISKMFGSLQGETEANVALCIKTIEAIAPCVVLLDEIEKLLSGTGSSNKTDGGTGDRVMGKILSWLQEKESPVFVVATANRLNSLPPELLRKGRFDELFFVGLPDESERFEILKIHLDKNKIKLKEDDIHKLVLRTNNFSGAEIEAAIIESKYIAFDKEQETSYEDITKAIEETRILFDTQKEIIKGMVQWAEERARFANSYNRNTILSYEGNSVSRDNLVTDLELINKEKQDG